MEGKIEMMQQMLDQTKRSAADATGLLYDQLRGGNKGNEKKKSKRSHDGMRDEDQ